MLEKTGKHKTVLQEGLEETARCLLASISSSFLQIRTPNFVGNIALQLKYYLPDSTLQVGVSLQFSCSQWEINKSSVCDM